ncbi:MAG: DUF2970 domain-containing protein [Pseudomonadota bacterium]
MTTNLTEEAGMSEEKDKPGEKAPGMLKVMLSVVAAAFGVQTEANREQDFSQSNPLPYIVGGLIFTLLFVLTLVGIVMLVLP